jgi:predicted ATPase
LLLNSRNGEQVFQPINVGFGYSYVLPVVVSALMAEKGSVLVVENPEAHLHPRAQSRIMEFLVKQALDNDLQLIIETHSDHVVNGLRISMKKGILLPKDGLVQHFAYDNGTVTPVITTITSDQEGNLSSYPDDFMDEWTEQMMQLV